MKHLFTLPLAAVTLAATASAAGMPPTSAINAPVPSGFEDFYPAMRQKGISENALDGSAMKSRPMPRRLAGDVMQAPAAKAPAQGNLYGFLNNTDLENLKLGLYDVNPSTGNSTFLWQDELTEWGWSTYTGWIRDGRLCTLSGVKLNGAFMGYGYLEFDLSDGTIHDIEYIDPGNDGMQTVFISSAYRPLDDKVYGYTYNEDGTEFCFSEAPATDISQARIVKNVMLEDLCTAMTYDSLTDTMYGITSDGRFVKVGFDGSIQLISNLSRSIPNLDALAASGMAWSPSLQACVYNAYIVGTGTVFYAFDPTGKEAPKRMGHSLGAEIYSILVSNEPNALPDAPLQAEFGSYDFAGPALEGSISWTLPAKLMDGNDIKVPVDWTLYIDGIEYMSGSGTAGSGIVTPVSGVSNGQHTYALICGVEGYSGEPAIHRHWTGADAPLPPANARLTENLVSWDVPTGSVHDGYVDTSAITYTVYLNGGKIGETSETSLSYTLPEGEPFTSYTAEIEASYMGWASEKAVSNFITYGDPLNMPVHFRPEEKELEMMTLINVDGHKFEDGRDDTWRFTTDMGFPSFASGYNGDDWLILPPMTFDNVEKAYRFEMEIGLVHDSDTSGTYEVCIGKEPTAEAMTRVIIPESHCLHMLGDILEEFFAVPEAGVYYIGIHTKTNKVSFHVSDIDVSLSNRSADVPLGATGLVAVPGADAALTAAVSFTMPVATASGRDIPADKSVTATVCSYSTELGYNKERTLVDTKTVTGLPGSVQKLDITTAQNYNAIVVTCSVDGLEGKSAETIIYTGVDRPYLVNDLQMKVSEDNMSVKLTWTPPTEGEEGGPIGDTFLYVIYDYQKTWTYVDEAGWDVYEYTYTKPAGTPLGYYSVGVMAYNAAGLSYHVAGRSVSMGEPLQLPWVDDLREDVTYDNLVILCPDEQYNDTYWVNGDPGEMISPIFSLPSRLALIGYTYLATDRKTLVALPKISTAGYSDVQFSIDYWGGRNAAQMRIYGESYDFPDRVLIAQLPRDAEGWTTYTTILPAEMQDQGWMLPMVEADLPDDQYFAMISGYSLSSKSGVSLIGEGEGFISGGRGSLTVAGHTGEALIVTDMSGRTVLQRSSLEDYHVFFLPAGIYAVRAGEATAKVVVL